MSTRIHRAPRSFGVSACLAVSVAGMGLLACDGARLALGSNDGGGPDGDAAHDAGHDAPTSVVTQACPPVNESDYPALRGSTCEGACSEAQSLTRDLSSPDVLAAALAGQWQICSGSLGPVDLTTTGWMSDAGPTTAIGIEFDPGCVIFFLYVVDRELVRGSSSSDQATYDVVATGDAATGVVLHLANGDVSATVTASGCLGRARLTTDAGVVEMSTFTLPNVDPSK